MRRRADKKAHVLVVWDRFETGYDKRAVSRLGANARSDLLIADATSVKKRQEGPGVGLPSTPVTISYSDIFLRTDGDEPALL